MARDVSTIIDSLNFFVESRNVGNILSATTTATGGITSPDFVNTNQQGALFFITMASVTVTGATLALNINAKDVSASTYFPYARVSLDGLTASSSLQYMLMLYIGAASTPVILGGGAALGVSFAENMTILPLPVPPVFQIVSSLTISNTTATMSGTASYRVDYEKVM